MKIDVSVVVGTRPEAIKCAPVVLALRECGLSVRLISSGQQADLLPAALDAFDLAADVHLHTMHGSPDLSLLTAKLMDQIAAELKANRPRLALVHGDTATTLAGAMGAFYTRVPCAHIEAGLRSGRLDAPWPEEMNRLIADRLCTRHYAPTERARHALRTEGIAEPGILVTGQTGVDAVRWMADKLGDSTPGRLADYAGKRLIYVTAHRRENTGGGIEATLRGVALALDEHDDYVAVLSAHPNPDVRAEAQRVTHNRLIVVDPLSYPESIWMLKHAAAIVTDSGGIQEEAPSFGTPVLVTREVTERPEGLEAGFLRLVGCDATLIAATLKDVVTDSALRQRLAATPNPYGDGLASTRIADDISSLLSQ